MNPTKNKHIVIEVLGLDKQASYLNGSKTATPYDGSGAVDLYSNAGKDDGADGADINSDHRIKNPVGFNGPSLGGSIRALTPYLLKRYLYFPNIFK